MWTDALDSPVVRYLENLFVEPYPEEQQLSGHGAGGRRRVHFPWTTAYEALMAQAEREADPFDDVVMEYLDPVTGRSILPTLGCALQMIRPGVRTRAHRETTSTVYHVYRGTGATTIDGVRFDWGEGDFFCVPPRALHGHANDNGTPAILYRVTDKPLVSALGFYRMDAE